jgi:hypothetical protein
MGSASIQKHREDATCHVTIVGLEKGSHSYESMCTPKLKSCWRGFCSRAFKAMGGAVRRGGVDCVRGQLDLLTRAGRGFEYRVFACGIHIEVASSSTEVPDHGLTMLLKLGVATVLRRGLGTTRSVSRVGFGSSHEVASTSKDRDMAVGNEYRLAVGLGLFNTPRIQDKQVIWKQCCIQRTSL